MSAFKKGKPKSIDVEYTTKDLPMLRRKRTIAHNRLQKALELGNLSLTDHSQRDMFLSYYQEIKDIAATFEHAHLNILQILEPSDSDDLDDTYERFDEMYYNVLAIHRSITRGQSESSSRVSSNSNIRLPKIVLPHFSGDIKRWPEYFDTFNELIHNCPSLSDIEKFHYLTSSLSGEALFVVKAFPLSHEHYEHAYQALIARYKCKRALTFTCWKDLLAIEFKCTNGIEFRKSLDLFEENLSILKTAELPIQHWDFILVYHILSKLDSTLRRSFEEKYSDVDLPTYKQLIGFLRTKCEALLRDTHFTENKLSKQVIKPASSTPFQKPFNKTNALIASADVQQNSKNVAVSNKCPFCAQTHTILSCSEFLKKPVEERIKITTERNWCYNCLKSSHQLKNCNSVFSCRVCKRKHHSLLHREKGIENNNTSSLVTNSKSNTAVLLATAIVQVKDSSGCMQSFRALFDSGSQNNFITTAAVNRLQLQIFPSSSHISGIGETQTSIVGHVRCQIGHHDKIIFNLDMHVIDSICGDQPIAKLKTTEWSHIESLPLADPGFDIPGPIDILFAADVFTESLLNKTIKGGPNQPTAFNSVFGWLLLGKSQLASNSLLNTSLQDDNELNSLVKQFWELDSLPQASSLTPEESLCEHKFKTTHTRDESGRYIVKLPFKHDSEPIFEGSRDVALRRFSAIERRLSRDPELRRQYSEFMEEYQHSGHMSLVPIDEMGRGKYYIPHHCVLRPDSVTTRLRVVFDASARDLRSRSLNDSQLIGPKLQPNLLEILLRFREHEIVFIADVRAMYRQILISPEHRDYQRILWRFSPADPLREYRLNTVTYGVSSSPFLACRTVRQLAEDSGDGFPLAKQIALSDVYIDDVITGQASLNEALEAKSQIIALFELGCFHLRKWMSNDPQLLADLPPEDCLTESVSFDDSETLTLKVLGLKWDPKSDAFLFEVKSSNQSCTKRSILSEIARIFDPLGFLSPITIKAKCLIQRLWILGVGWDQTPPEEIVKIWDIYRANLSCLADVKIPRKITSSIATSYELHGFCDSSEIAYGAVIYLRFTDHNGEIQVRLICSKARVAPLKRISLPRLELCAAVLLSDLFRFVRDTYVDRIPLSAAYMWSDSTIVLSWLRSHSSRWVTFVANRVSHIHDIIPTECWHHVPSEENPADVCSRGQFPDEIVHNSLWWAGPSWLSKDRTTWPNSFESLSPSDEAVVKSESKLSSVLLIEKKLTESHQGTFEMLLSKFSSLQKLLNVLAYINRFIRNAKNSNRPNCNLYITNVERHNALMQIVKHVQQIAFSQEILNIKAKRPILKQFKKLNPFLDDYGILRVGGRISRSGLEYEHKHPALLPPDHPLTILIIDFIHRNYCHTGINTTHFLLLQQFWIISAKRVVRSRLSKCVQCYRTNSKPLQPFMSDLPSYRVNQIKPFSVVGVDFGGPFRIKLGSHRGAKIDKAYLCLFVCLATKAVHLEVVSTLSAEGFIAALRRFIGRRGRCNVIHADCGTNFVGARNQLSALMERASVAEKIDFKFNPPSAPHFGGVWEIQIKAAKTHLHRVVGDQVLTFEELTTLFVQIESILNSRPLYPLSSDPNDLTVLTPGHFLTLEPLTAVPDEDHTNTKLHRLNRWQLLQSFHQNFWSRWKHEYLNSLTERAKWTKESKPLSVGSMVIIKDDNRIPLQWSLGRVVDLHFGADGIARSAVVKTSQNHLTHRPLVKLCPLPIEQ
ncbi:uncharacterized protein LOC123663725 [Melitaea cinxia]|uniref:uncharacterized protein LOC123663725 n=1 Tax=Melitaea cinxia TaxID=113334 RepID=UPI001E26F3FF|nr:uncharacterized protein LOC123663725 [Melitaea cinxia]